MIDPDSRVYTWTVALVLLALSAAIFVPALSASMRGLEAVDRAMALEGRR